MLTLLTLRMPNPDPSWLNLTKIEITGRYAIKIRNPELRKFITQGAAEGKLFIPGIKSMVDPSAIVKWTVVSKPMSVLAPGQGKSPEDLTWAVDVGFGFLGKGKTLEKDAASFVKAWTPVFNGIMHFAMPFEDVEYADVVDGQQDKGVILRRP